MANLPSSGTVYNNAQAGRADPNTPGMQSIANAWAALQTFTGNGAVNRYNYASALARAIQEQSQ